MLIIVNGGGGGNALYSNNLLVKRIRSYCARIYYTYRSIKKWGRLHRTFVFDREREVVYLNNPKVACTSIKESMFGKQPDINSLSENSTIELSTEMKEYYKFTFVRNPFKRLVSCFEDKCIQHPDDPCWNYYLFSSIIRVRDFSRFVRRIFLLPDSFAEPHFAGQYRLIYDKDNTCLADFVGKIENITTEYEPIRERFNFLPLEHSNRAASKTGKNWMDYYTPFTARLVYWKYKKDFETFGYEEEYQKLKSYLKNKSYDK